MEYSDSISLIENNFMEAGKILSADILDIIFDGRNKNYGAYLLRKTYNKRLLAALSISAFIVLIILGLSKAFVPGNIPVINDNLPDMKSCKPANGIISFRTKKNCFKNNFYKKCKYTKAGYCNR